MRLRLILPLLLLGARSSAERDVSQCLDEMVDESKQAGWALRTKRVRTVTSNLMNHFLMQLYESTRYKLVGCGEEEFQLVRFSVFDEDARLVAQSDGFSPRATLQFVPPHTGSYFVGIETIAAEHGSEVAVGFAVTYR